MPRNFSSFSSEQSKKIDRVIRKLQRKVREKIANGWVSQKENTSRRAETIAEFIQSVLTDASPRRFEEWSRFEIVRAIIGENIELRGESTVTLEILKG